MVRISVRAKEDIALPMVGFMLRNQLGMDFSGTNTAREGYELPPMQAGDVYTVDFHLDLPELYPASFSFSPAIADGTLTGYTMCDWIDNAIALQMSRRKAQIYGYMRLPCRVEVNARLALGGRRQCWRDSLAEFTGERVIPGQVDVDLLNEHLARYTFAARLARGKRVLDAGCGAGYGSAELAHAAQTRDRASMSRRRRWISRARTTGCRICGSSRLRAPRCRTAMQLRPGGGVRGDRAPGELARLPARGAARAGAERAVHRLHAQQAVLHGIARRARARIRFTCTSSSSRSSARS